MAKVKEAARKDLSLDEILTVACGLIERDGVDAFTMRRLANELGRSTMATYRHVGNKDELILAAADSVLANVRLPDNPDATWNERFHDVALATWSAIEHARWIPTYLVARQVSTPNLQRILTAVEEIVVESGLPRAQAEKVVVMSWTFTIGLLSTVPNPEPYLKFGIDVIAAGVDAQSRASKTKAPVSGSKRTSRPVRLPI